MLIRIIIYILLNKLSRVFYLFLLIIVLICIVIYILINKLSRIFFLFLLLIILIRILIYILINTLSRICYLFLLLYILIYIIKLSKRYECNSIAFAKAFTNAGTPSKFLRLSVRLCIFLYFYIFV